VLYLIATPIGNLADLSFRAVEILQIVDYILCEDTRHSRHLLKHYQIDKPLKSFHQFNETQREEKLLEDLRMGKRIALISDAGTPTLCDPGYQLVKRCREEGISITSLPGACAAITALTISGFDPLPFQFVGFLPKKNSEKNRILQHLLIYTGTSIAYESPHRIEETLTAIHAIDSQRKVGIARELTKIYEECLIGTAQELLQHFQKNPARGEMVLLISRSEETVNWEGLSIKEHITAIYENGNMTVNEVIKIVAEMRGLPKRTVYQAFHQND
jgi:16S rRNA (cytidine1402-2'-O)-methyltransferase